MSTILWLIVPIAKDAFTAIEKDGNLASIHLDRAIVVILTLLFLVSFILTANLAYKCTAAPLTDVLIL